MRHETTNPTLTECDMTKLGYNDFGFSVKNYWRKKSIEKTEKKKLSFFLRRRAIAVIIFFIAVNCETTAVFQMVLGLPDDTMI